MSRTNNFSCMRLLLIFGLFISFANVCSAAPIILLEDNFNDNSIDNSLWNVVTAGIPQNPKSVNEVGGQMAIEGRAHLNTASQFNPTDPLVGGIKITGVWTFGTDDMIQILTRTDGTPSGGYGETANGIEIYAQGWDSGTLQIRSRGAASVSSTNNSLPSGIFGNGNSYYFEITDDGTNLTATLTDVNDSSRTVTSTATSTYAPTTNLITFHNREGSRTANLDDVVIESLTLTTGEMISIASGNWNAATTWDGNRPAVANDDITVLGHTVDVTGNEAGYYLTLNNVASVVDIAPTGNLAISHDVNINAGTLYVQGSFTAPNAKVAADATLAIDGGTLNLPYGTIDGETSFSGTATINTEGMIAANNVTATSGTLIKQGAGLLSFDQSTALNSLAAGTTVQVDAGELKMRATSNPLGGADLTLNGGTFTVHDNADNQLAHYGYHINNDGLALNLDGNGGMMDGGDPTTFQNFYGQAVLTDGPDGVGLAFDGDAEFQATGVIDATRNDNYSNLWYGTLHVSEANAGDWTFRRTDQDDATGIWIDLNGNGIFESISGGLGSNNGEQLAYNDGNTHTVTLAAGGYNVAFTHREGGGGSRARFAYSSPGMGGDVTINPGASSQADLWSVKTPDSLDMTDSDVMVLTSSRLNALTRADAAFGSLDFQAGTLTTSGADGGISFTGTTLSSSATLGFNTIVNTTTGAISGGNGSTIIKTGDGDLIIDQAPTAGSLTTGTTFDVQQGRLRVVNPNPNLTLNPIGSADVNLYGGTLAIEGTTPDMTGTNIAVLTSSTVEGITSSNAAFGPVTLYDGTTLTTQGASGSVSFTSTTVEPGASNVTIKTLTNTTAGQLNGSGAGATIVKTGSADWILDQAPIGGMAGTTFEVQKGRMVVGNLAANPTGGEDIVLNGGTLAVQGEEIMVSGLSGSIFRGTPNNDTPVNLDGATYQMVGGRVFTGSAGILNMTEDTDNNVIINGSTQNWNGFPNFDGNDNNFVTAFSGQFKPNTTGSYNFHWNNDDAGLMYIDLNHNNTFESSEQVAGYAWDANGNVTLNSSETYNVIYMAQEYGGGQGVWWSMTEPGVGATEAIIDTTDGRGTWQTLTNGPIDIQNTVIVNNQSTDGLNVAGYMFSGLNDGNNQLGLMDLDADGSLLDQKPAGITLLEGQLQFNGDTQWRELVPEVTRDNDYQFLFTGQLNTEGMAGGSAQDYELRFDWSDDRSMMWVDLDQDGIFERAGDLGDERISWEDQSTQTISLLPGTSYDVAFGHLEYGGGSNYRVWIKTPSMSGQELVDPTATSQAGLWTTIPTSTLELLTDSTATLNNLILQNGDLVIKGGDLLTVATTSISPSTGGNLGLYPETDTILTGTAGLNGNGQTATITKGGSADLVLTRPGTGLDAATFITTEGRLVGVDNDAFGGAALEFNGGDLVLSSTGGTATFDNSLNLVKDTTLTAGVAWGGTAGQTVNLGSAGNGVNVPAGITLTTNVTDNYTLNIEGPLSGTGTVSVTQGTANFNGGGTIGTLTYSSDATVGASQLAITDTLTVPMANYSISAPDSFTVDGANLAVSKDITLSGGTMTVTPTAPSIISGALHNWTFDEPVGSTTAIDSIGGKTGTLNGNPVYVPGGGQIGGAINLDGGGDYVLVAANGSPVDIPGNSFSISFWAKRNSLGEDYVIGMGDTTTTDQSLHIGFRDGDTFTHAFWGDDLNWDNAAIIGDTSDYHLWTVTYDATTNRQEIYVDGSYANGRNANNDFLGSGTNNLYIGRRAPGQEADAMIDDVWVFDHALSQSEIDSLLQSGIAGWYDGNLYQSTTNFTVESSTTMNVDITGKATFGDLTLESNPTLTLQGAPGGTSFGSVTGPGTISTPSSVAVRDKIDLATGEADTLNIQGDLIVHNALQYDWEQGDVVDVDGTLDIIGDWVLNAIDPDAVFDPMIEYELFTFDELLDNGNPLVGQGLLDGVTVYAANPDTSTRGAKVWFDTLGDGSGRIYLTGLITPEPGTFIFAAIGLLGLVFYRRRKR